MNNLVYLYKWNKSSRYAIFPYVISNPPTSLYFCGKFDNKFALYEAIKVFAVMSPNKSISFESYKTILLTDFTLEIATIIFEHFFPDNLQLKLDI